LGEPVRARVVQPKPAVGMQLQDETRSTVAVPGIRPFVHPLAVMEHSE